VVRANGLKSCYLRPLVWIGSEKLGVSPKGNRIHAMVAAAWSWGAYLGEDGMKRGIRVQPAATRHHVNITMTQAKTVSNYTNSILANMEATDEGYDEAVLLDTSGFVSEGAGENLFVVKDGTVYTPDLSAGALNGITRNTVLHICTGPGPPAGAKSASRATSATSPTRCSSPARRPRSRRSASTTASPSAPASAAPSPRRSKRVLRHRERPQRQVRPLAGQGLSGVPTTCAAPP
jgi:hypothetical protein